VTPDELLDRYPREGPRFLRQRLGMSQLALAPHLGVNPKTLSNREARRHGISEAQRAQLVALLAPHLATPEGEACLTTIIPAGR
jgi:DNA-binding transcriptional regulator YiaG